jgi:acyl-CoA thioester hydrolase
MIYDDINLGSADSYRFWTAVTIRFSDQDPLGHVNNCAYAAYIEASRTMFLGHLLNDDSAPDIDFSLVNLNINYLKEMCYPGTVDIGARVLKLGNKSITSGFGVFLGDDCVATSTSVNVFFSTTKRISMPIPDDVRAWLDTDPMLEKLDGTYTRQH